MFRQNFGDLPAKCADLTTASAVAEEITTRYTTDWRASGTLEDPSQREFWKPSFDYAGKEFTRSDGKKLRVAFGCVDVGGLYADEVKKILRGGKVTTLHRWMEQARKTGIHSLVHFVRTLKQDLSAVEAAVSEPWSNGPVEGQLNRLKMLKRQMYGRAGIELLRARLLPEPAFSGP